MSYCIKNNHLKLKQISISQRINHNMSKKKKTTTTNKFIYLSDGFHKLDVNMTCLLNGLIVST